MSKPPLTRVGLAWISPTAAKNIWDPLPPLTSFHIFPTCNSTVFWNICAQRRRRMQKQEAWLRQLFPFDCNDTGYFVIMWLRIRSQCGTSKNSNCPNYVICRRIATIFIPLWSGRWGLYIDDVKSQVIVTYITTARWRHRNIKTALTMSFIVGSRRSLYHRNRRDHGYTLAMSNSVCLSEMFEIGRFMSK